MSDHQPSIPIVDLTPFTNNGDNLQRQKAAQELFDACHQYGFVNITGHGVSAERLEEAFGWCKKLFSLPHESKMKAPHPETSIPHRGYSHPGLEKAYSKEELQAKDVVNSNGESLRKIMDFKESYEIGSEENPTHPNIWLPEAILPGFREFMLTFYWELHTAICAIIDAISMALHLTDAEKSLLLKLHSGKNNQLRLLHYPPIAKDQLETQIMARMPAHNDWSSFTLLFQDQTGGLEFEDPSHRGTFLSALPLPNAVSLNIGDMLQRLTNGIFPSATHRVTIPSPSSSTSPSTSPSSIIPPRYSIPYFIAPDGHKAISCLPSCVTAARPAGFDPVTFDEYGADISKWQYKGGGDEGKFPPTT